ncbi:nitrilase cyanide hydratase and apolipoprotein n-acyltransferase : Putative amidohydrolase OS=Singulisphaera acidiphila (strain ATCC BAA-1392 / DSM 18658 / VKM B-2454 / MOB10) GN=Sinac_6000 PE=4 SV=1: CN_hydrolase [Gemmata massiliana]|uniref:CN hydrolase domain-containing protein n=1 Tax=Gemmata massiliana TaxID=1210884 RepID=A0A6P2CRS4_9BACT|nr:carbon-nitrogen hydrolase family protein [Gemmata massiliana]VTR91798.1 nitrilase cyanide hydratase and apolipoprotein n-acyltransferase : Putative amidohydrolase OS=Singulisphaera acidiphila (strain ATCC BAA-1392 / DSM 18658 / VKM B-2454 / MOB10) GN=Sinac_6000 PE=4 SV=1: CN_hydrolase [Gemmata massiliana]
MSNWTVAGVQMNCALGDLAANRAALVANLRRAAERGAKLVVFPECVLSGYGFTSRAHALGAAEPLPGPSTEFVAKACAELGVWAVFGLLESAPGDKLYNAAALVGPQGFVVGYRKLHLPCLGADRFTDPGDRPLAVHDLGGLKLGMNICFDGSFPESARILTLLGADLVVLPTNWATNARKMAELVSAARAWENHIYYLAVNRVGDESGFRYIGLSSAADYMGNVLHFAPESEEAIFTIDVNPAAAAQKRVVTCVGEYEIDRVNWRRPEMYGPLVANPGAFTGHFNK